MYLWERVRVFGANGNGASGVQQYEVGQHEEVCVGDRSLELECLHELDDGGAGEELLVALLDEATVAVVAQGHQLREVDVGTVLEDVRSRCVQGVPCPRGLGFVDLDLECSTTLLGQ